MSIKSIHIPNLTGCEEGIPEAELPGFINTFCEDRKFNNVSVSINGCNITNHVETHLPLVFCSELFPSSYLSVFLEGHRLLARPVVPPLLDRLVPR